MIQASMHFSATVPSGRKRTVILPLSEVHFSTVEDSSAAPGVLDGQRGLAVDRAGQFVV
jgi:hypothetical protein